MNLANKITTVRILSVPLFVALIVYSQPFFALLVFIIAVMTDALDGYVARAWHQKTKLGAILDPLADKLLIISAFLCLIFVRDLTFPVVLPPYVPIIVISRDMIILIGCVVIHVVRGSIAVKPSRLGKITTFFQMLTVIFILSGIRYANVIWNIMVVCTVLSGIDYVVKGSRLLNENKLEAR